MQWCLDLKCSENNELTDENDKGWTIYRDGKWAEIIEEPKVLINGYEMKQDGDIISFGCAKFDIHQLQRWEYFINREYKSNRKIKSIKLDSGIEITVKQLKEIVDNSKDNMLILCGHTNSDLDTQPECSWLLSNGECVDTYHLCNNEEGFTWSDTNPYTKGWLINENQRIDGILLNNNMSKNCEIINSRLVFNKENEAS